MKSLLVLDNDIQQITQLAEFIEQFAEQAGLDMALTMNLNLALEEAVSNVMMYAYPEGTKGQLEIEAGFENGKCTFVISDSGVPFDPTTKQDADISLSVEERPIGGLGIFLVKNIMDSVSYTRKGEKNVLTLTKKV